MTRKEALDIVLQLSEGNMLDADCDSDLQAELYRQSEAYDIVKAMLEEMI